MCLSRNRRVRAPTRPKAAMSWGVGLADFATLRKLDSSMLLQPPEACLRAVLAHDRHTGCRWAWARHVAGAAGQLRVAQRRRGGDSSPTQSAPSLVGVAPCCLAHWRRLLDNSVLLPNNPQARPLADGWCEAAVQGRNYGGACCCSVGRCKPHTCKMILLRSAAPSQTLGQCPNWLLRSVRKPE